MPRSRLQSFSMVYWHILVECIYHHNDPHFKLSFTLPDRKMAISFRHRFHSFRSALSRHAPSAAQAMYEFCATINNNQTVVIEAGFADIMSLRLKQPLPALAPEVIASTAERLRSRLTGMQPMTMQDVNTLLGPTPQAAFTGSDAGAEGTEIPAHIRALIKHEEREDQGTRPLDQDQVIRAFLDVKK